MSPRESQESSRGTADWLRAQERTRLTISMSDEARIKLHELEVRILPNLTERIRALIEDQDAHQYDLLKQLADLRAQADALELAERQLREERISRWLRLLLVFGWCSDPETQATVEDIIWGLRKQVHVMRKPPKYAGAALSERSIRWIVAWRVCITVANILALRAERLIRRTVSIVALLKGPARPDA